MHQLLPTGQIRAAVLALAATLALGSSAGAQDIPKCQAAIVKNAQKYTSTRVKALQKCEESVLTGKLPGPCPDAKAADKISKAATKLADGVAKACTGVTVADLGFAGLVNRCVGGDNDGSRCADTFDCPNGGVCTGVDECPTFLNGRLPGDDGCEIPLASPADVAECLECATNAKVDAVLDAFYATLKPASTDKDVLKCQKDIGKRTAKFFDAVEKSLAKCEDARLKGKVASCPDSKAADKISKSLTKLGEAIAKTCADGATINRAANAGRIWGAAPAFGACAVSGAETPAGLSGALACLAQNAADCDVALSIAGTTCSTGLCGNGQIDAGETCDDGNTARDSGSGGDDICPPDCVVAACNVSGTQDVTINITTPEDLIGANILLTYDDGKVSIPAIGNAAPVLARVSSLTFATSPRDTDTALRINLDDPTVIGQPGVNAATVTFDLCGGAVSAADFGCMVVDAANASFEAISGVSCSVSVP